MAHFIKGFIEENHDQFYVNYDFFLKFNKKNISIFSGSEHHVFVRYGSVVVVLIMISAMESEKKLYLLHK